MKHANPRLPDDLHARLTEAAKTDDRPLNSEIIHLLRRDLDERRSA